LPFWPWIALKKTFAKLIWLATRQPMHANADSYTEAQNMASFAIWSNVYYGCIGIAALAQAVMVTAAVAFIAGSATPLFSGPEKAPLVGLV